MAKINEECGVFAVFSPAKKDLASMVYYGLHALQHRGQEGCGAVINDDGVFSSYKDLGIVTEVFTKSVLEKLPDGNIALGHTRYGAAGSNDRANCQPLVVNHIKGNLALAQNGSIVNCWQLRQELELGGAIFHTTSDAEVISYLVMKERLSAPSIEEAVYRAIERLEGAYSLVVMSPTKLIAVRDPKGFRPLCYGKTDEGDYVVASESCALDSVGAHFIRDIDPGELIVFRQDGIVSMCDRVGKCETSKCIFEYIYFARPDSVIDGTSVHTARLRAGRFLAQEHPVDADVVIGVPDSGLDGAMGYAMESGIPYDIGLIKNKYIGRTFIAPGQKKREKAVKMKLNPISSTVNGKKVVLIDDSIVRGTTSAQIVKLLRDAGAREIHMMVTAPRFVGACYYGTDIDSPECLIANQHTDEEIARIIGVDSLGFLSVENVVKIADEKAKYCLACFDRKYPTSIPQNTGKYKFEKKISEKEKD